MTIDQLATCKQCNVEYFTGYFIIGLLIVENKSLLNKMYKIVGSCNVVKHRILDSFTVIEMLIEGLQNVGLCWVVLTTIEQGGVFFCATSAVTWYLVFWGLIE